ncbi:hypothetical protein [Pseudomonas sp. HY2-MNA-CIBAN-0224]|uniref:hypothetical protein n=1 Tax=Pseudomonas sp. HY2-MNA-CIBAN-0224 TaxID=3140471 RepID=UPI003321BDA4
MSVAQSVPLHRKPIIRAFGAFLSAQLLALQQWINTLYANPTAPLRACLATFFEDQKIARRARSYTYVLLSQLLRSQQQVDRLHGSCCYLRSVKFDNYLIYMNI